MVRPVGFAAVGAITVVVALLVPWAHYGGIGVRLHEIPGWPLYLAAATAQQLSVVAGLRSNRRGRRVAMLALGLAFGAATMAAAITLMLASQDPATVFGQVVPPIAPVLASGGPVALAAAAVSTAASVLAMRAWQATSSGPGDRAGA